MQNPRTLQVGDEVKGAPHENGIEEGLRQLHQGLREEVGCRAIRGGRVLAQEDTAVEREAQQERLGGAKHAADEHLSARTKVRLKVVARAGDVSHALEDACEHGVEDERREDRGDEPRLVPPYVEGLADRERIQLPPEASRSFTALGIR